MSLKDKLKKKLATYALGTLLLTVAVPIYLTIKHHMAEPAGAKCGSMTKCRGAGIWSSGMCLDAGGESYCTHDCSSSDDCSSGLACEAVEGTFTTEVSRGGMHASSTRTSQGTKLLCVRGSSNAN
jgi:hypothetical protein